MKENTDELDNDDQNDQNSVSPDAATDPRSALLESINAQHEQTIVAQILESGGTIEPLTIRMTAAARRIQKKIRLQIWGVLLRWWTASLQ